MDRDQDPHSTADTAEAWLKTLRERAQDPMILTRLAISEEFAHEKQIYWQQFQQEHNSNAYVGQNAYSGVLIEQERISHPEFEGYELYLGRDFPIIPLLPNQDFESDQNDHARKEAMKHNPLYVWATLFAKGDGSHIILPEGELEKIQQELQRQDNLPYSYDIAISQQLANSRSLVPTTILTLTKIRFGGIPVNMQITTNLGYTDTTAQVIDDMARKTSGTIDLSNPNDGDDGWVEMPPPSGIVAEVKRADGSSLFSDDPTIEKDLRIGADLILNLFSIFTHQQEPLRLTEKTEDDIRKLNEEPSAE